MEGKKLILRVRNLSVVLDGKKILEDISFDLYEGEILAVLGPNGAGKSTLLKAILGMTPYTGEVYIAPGYRPGYIPQALVDMGKLPATARDVIVMGFRGYSREEVLEAARKLNIESHLDDLFVNLSGGLKQRTLIAKALVYGSRILLLDEPTSNLDIQSQRRFYDILKQLKEKEKISAIMVSHDLGVVSSYADRVLCLNVKMFYHGAPGKELNIDLIRKVYGHDVGVIIHDH